MRTLAIAAYTAATVLAAVACTIDARPEGGGVLAAAAPGNDALATEGVAQPDADASADTSPDDVECILHSDCEPGIPCLNGRCGVAASSAETVAAFPSDAGSAPNCMPTNEVCDGRDNDCDGVVDEGCPAPPPSDGGSVVHAAGEPEPAPSTETCGDGLDNNGDGLADEGCAPQVPPSDSVTVTLGCPANDAACVLSGWWGSGRSLEGQSGRWTVVLDIQRCAWGLDLNARQGSAAGPWYSDINRLGDLNPVLVNGVAVTGRPVCDTYGCNLNVSPAQLGCGS